jgi:hypothetical protein
MPRKRLQVCPIFCLTIGVHPTIWVHLGSSKTRILCKAAVEPIRRAKTNQRDSKLRFNYEPEGREFDSLRARHSFPFPFN